MKKDKLNILCEEINQSVRETRALAYAHDVANYDEVPALLQKIVADLGGLDTFIFMAGINYPPGGNDKYNFDNDRQMVEINLIGAMAWLNEAFGGKFPVLWSLGIIGALLAASIIASLVIPAKPAPAPAKT